MVRISKYQCNVNTKKDKFCHHVDDSQILMQALRQPKTLWTFRNAKNLRYVRAGDCSEKRKQT